MIVKDKQKTVSKADKVALKLTKIIQKEILAFDCDNEPAEILYFVAHITGNILARMAIFLGESGNIYGTDLQSKALDWVINIAEEHMNLNVVKEKQYV